MDKIFSDLKKQKCTYDVDFMIEHPYYTLKIVMNTRNRYLRMVFNSMCKVARLKKDLREVNEIDIDFKYFKLIESSIDSIMKDEFKTAAKQGVYVNSHKIGNCTFVRNKNNASIWDIHIGIVGEYSGLK